jgi:hypothetical protein
VALPDVLLSLLTFPQRFSAGTLETRVLLLPASDPTVAIGALPAFAGHDWALRASVLPGANALTGTVVGTQLVPFTAAAPDGAAALFQAMRLELQPEPPPPSSVRSARLGATTICKTLPPSYTQSFPFERAGPGTGVGKEFACALRDTVPAMDGDPKPPATLTWGAVVSFALRQPRLARALGLIHDLTISLTPDDLLEAGGWLLVELDPAGAVTPSPGVVRSYAARLPPLAADADRALFGAVLIPAGLSAAGDYGDAMAEAARYDDGFAKIVHAVQAVTADATSSGHNQLSPGTDAGIDLGWDDEQVTLWHNRQIECLRARLGAAPNPGAKVVEAPLGIAGYRIDVRQTDPTPMPAGGGWESLCRATSVGAAGTPAPLRFPPPPKPVAFSERFDGELTVEPVPVRSIHAADEVAWLPQHFARWQGGSLVVDDPTLFRLTGSSPNDANGDPLSVGQQAYRAPTPAVRLRYGRSYEFRCRLADLTGGGPATETNDSPLNPALHPTAKAHFVRHIPPKSVRLTTDIPRPAPGKAPPASPTVTTINVWRPLIGYPEMVFAGIDDPVVIATLVANAAAARDAGDAVGVNDPDVTHVVVSVQVRAPAHDHGPDDVRDGSFREVYRTEIAFPPFDGSNVLALGAPLALTLRYIDVPDVATIVAPAVGATTLPIPRARDVRLRLTPLCADKPGYFGSAAARIGLTVDVATRDPAVAEADLHGALPLRQNPLAAIVLHPANGMVQRLADRLQLSANGLKLTARPGERVIFAASAALRHMVSTDRDSITFASEGELLGHWIAVLQVEVARDWTWDGLEDQGFLISRSDGLTGPMRTIGQIPVPFAVSTLATLGPNQPGNDRRAQSRLVFFDAVDPSPGANAFPRQPTPHWRIEPRLRGFTATQNAELAQTHSLVLPITVPPRQMPKLVSAGIALSPYVADDDYAATQPRRRVLWFELDEPIADPNDALYARVLAYGPDPLLSGAITHILVPAPDFPVGPSTWFELVERLLPAPPDPPDLPVDPELMRVIVPGQPDDKSGLDAMLEMAEAFPPPGATRSRHFIVPLPPGLDADAPELFGFWTYEIRVGHKRLWSTAQARFGRPLVVKGVQHPAPGLRCTAVRVRPSVAAAATEGPPRIVVSAPHATAVFQDKRLTDPRAGDPRTRIWVLLYAQVTQADGASRRNVLLARTPAVAQLETQRASVAPATRDVLGVAVFDESDVARRLRELALSLDAPLSVIAVELLPSDHLVQQSTSWFDHEVFYTVDVPDLAANAGVPTTTIAERPVILGDPLGVELGSPTSRRILRCSPLTPVMAAC